VGALEGSIEGKHLVITCTLTMNNQEIPPHALIDCGATGIAFMDQDLARDHHKPCQELKGTKGVQVIDVRPIESGDIKPIAKINMRIEDNGEQQPMFITKLGYCPIVLELHVYS